MPAPGRNASCGASTGTKDPKASDILYVEGACRSKEGLAAPFTVNAMPEGTLKAVAQRGEIGAMLAPDGGDCEVDLAAFAKAGIDIDVLAKRASGRRRGVLQIVVERPDGCIQIQGSAIIRKAS